MVVGVGVVLGRRSEEVLLGDDEVAIGEDPREAVAPLDRLVEPADVAERFVRELRLEREAADSGIPRLEELEALELAYGPVVRSDRREARLPHAPRRLGVVEEGERLDGAALGRELDPHGLRGERPVLGLLVVEVFKKLGPQRRDRAARGTTGYRSGRPGVTCIRSGLSRRGHGRDLERHLRVVLLEPLEVPPELGEVVSVERLDLVRVVDHPAVPGVVLLLPIVVVDLPQLLRL